MGQKKKKKEEKRKIESRIESWRSFDLLPGSESKLQMRIKRAANVAWPTFGTSGDK